MYFAILISHGKNNEVRWCKKRQEPKKTTYHPHGQQVVLYQISSIPDKTCRRLVQNWYRNEEIYILWNFIKRIYVWFLLFTVQSASWWGAWLVVIYSCLQVFISLCLCKIKRSYFSQLYATVYSYSQIGGKSVVRLVVNLFVFVRVPTLQDFFHLSNKLLLVRHIQDIPGCKNLIRQTAQRILGC